MKVHSLVHCPAVLSDFRTVLVLVGTFDGATVNDDIFVQTNSLQTIARVKCFMLHKVASVASFAPICMVFTISLAQCAQ